MNKIINALGLGVITGVLLDKVLNTSIIIDIKKDDDIIDVTDSNKVKVFISCPMNGKTDSEIEETIKKCKDDCIEKIKKIKPEAKIEFIDSFFKGQNYKNKAVACLSKAIKCLSEADYAYFGPGWEQARGCKIEHEIASQYNIECLYYEK